MNKTVPSLIDLGERRILKEIIPKFVKAAGDDCAIVSTGLGYLALTTDPVPPPAATVIGGDDDLFWTGWLLVTINASDIAASGAAPLAFVAALDLPNDLPVSSLERLLEGIQASCAANGLAYVGGNLREAPKVAAVGTAIGTVEKEALTRRGAQPGDLAVVIGRGGRFWADVMRHRAGIHVNPAESPLFSPVSQVATMHQLHGAGLVKCAMDTSDGLAPSLYEVASVNDLCIEVDLSLIRRASTEHDVGERSERLWMGWGDWTVLAAVAPSNMVAVAEIAEDGCTVIGNFSAGSGVFLVDGERRIQLGRLESERFAKDSWFSSGVDGYLKILKELPLP